MILFEYLIKKRPASVQSDGKTAWKEKLAKSFQQKWRSKSLITYPVRFSIVYLCDKNCKTDVDNIIKPIQDALNKVVIQDDFQIIDVDAHRRLFSEPIDATKLPELLRQGLLRSDECVYVQLSLPKDLDFFL